MLELDEGRSGRPVAIQAGEQVRVTLVEAGGTGYRWQVSEGCEALLHLREEHKGTAGTTPGASGSHVWVYSAQGAGSCELRFELSRSWEKTGERTVVFPVTVQSGH